MSIGHYIAEEDLGRLDMFLREFSNYEDITGFNINLTNFIFSDGITHTIYLNPVRKPNVPYLITGDTAFISFDKDESCQIEFAKKLRDRLVTLGFPHSIFIHNHDCSDSVMKSPDLKKVKYNFNRVAVEL